MTPRTIIEEQLRYTLQSIDIPGLGEKISGKVRDCYVVGEKRVLIASDRLSAFDVVLTNIPFKGQLLTEVASYWFEETKNLVRNHVLEHPHPNVLITQEVEVLPIEVVVRGYLAGSAWRDYENGAAVSGIRLPHGMQQFQRFERPLITPSTKAPRGEHDQPISSEEVIHSGIIEKKLWEEVCEAALLLFSFGTKRSLEHGLILVDTKYEFGVLTKCDKKQLILADEIHTQDSSRYWLERSYRERFQNNQAPEMLDKEFVRRRLIERGYMGEGTPPTIEDSFRVDTAMKYIEAYEIITGREFVGEVGSVREGIEEVLSRDNLSGK